MKSVLKNNLNNSIEHSILKAQGFKFSCDDINILNNLINSVATNENVNYFNLLKLLMLEKHNDNENEVLMIDDEVFNNISKENVILRANVGERFDINFFKNTPLYISNGANGSGLYFAENEYNYILQHFKKFEELQIKTGNVWKMVINPNANLIDRITLYKLQQRLIQAVNNEQYEDGTPLKFNCNKQILINLLNSDVSVIAILFGAQAIYVPFKHASRENGTSGDLILLDKNAVCLPKNGVYKCNMKIDLKDVATNESEIREKLSNFMYGEEQKK